MGHFSAKMSNEWPLQLMAIFIGPCKNSDFVWPLRSCDITPSGHYLWGAVKGKCYIDKPKIIDALKDNIPDTIGEIQLHTIDNVLKNWTDRVGYYMASRGSHLNEIIFIFVNRKDCSFK